MKDYYKILNINRDASIEEIKRSYRQLALKYHPDRNNGDKNYEEIFKSVTEAYTVLIDFDKRKKYDSERFQESNKQTNSQEKSEITPATFLKIFNDIKNTLLQAQPSAINAFKLYETLKELLSDYNISFLVKNATPEMNKMIVNEILICSSFIHESAYEILQPKLLILAQGNGILINTIKSYKQKTKEQNTTSRPLQDKSSSDFRGIFFIIFAVVIIFVIAYNSNKNPSTHTYEENHNVENGDLNNTFNEAKNSDNVVAPIEINKTNSVSEEDKLIADGWKESDLINGQMPSCYNFRPRRGSTDNMLEVHVGGGTDVVIKVMNINTEKCVRYVYINSGSTYQIKNIPEGIYYLKIAYGKGWYSKTENNKCVGRFLRNPLYEKGTDIMDFHVQYHGNSYSIPSFQLQLDVISDQNTNSFNSHDISETEFND